MGFQRVQAAQLSAWTGDRTDSQWQLLVRVARSLVSGQRQATVVNPSTLRTPTYHAPAPKRSGLPIPLIAGGGVALVVALVFAFFAINPPAPDVSAKMDAPVVESAGAPEARAPVSADRTDEVERLRREREDALAQQRAAEERAASAEYELAINRSPVGTWEGYVDWGQGQLRATWFLRSDGTFENGAGELGTWRQEGAQVRITMNGTNGNTNQAFFVGSVTGDTFSGTGSAAPDYRGHFSYTRQ